MSAGGQEVVNTDDFAGLGVRRPVTAALLTIFLLSLIGVPLTGSFSASSTSLKLPSTPISIWVTIIGLLNSAVAAYYYLRVIVVMYFRDPGESTVDLPPLAPAVQAVLWVAALAILVLDRSIRRWSSTRRTLRQSDEVTSPSGSATVVRRAMTIRRALPDDALPMHRVATALQLEGRDLQLPRTGFFLFVGTPEHYRNTLTASPYCWVAIDGDTCVGFLTTMTPTE